MTLSTITGDRRWASARRGGMTVLGKVAVPKPINLPSQRLENHGVDPNVEIVPKGTLSWGSRPSSSGSNAWGTSPLSPTTDGSSSSPRHLVGRPSSSGDTRPSTAGSERASDSNGNAWGTHSRPSSASGVMASNLASSSSLRPRSAENRPGSSHLSRFAESAPEGSGAWGADTAPERKGVAFSANDGFSLSSGDFPTLGSENDKSNLILDPLDHTSHGRPGSSGGVRIMSDGREISHDDDVSRNSDVKGNSWRNDGPPFMEDGPRPSMERWHREPRMYPNPNMAPHYESWRGASPVNPPGWYRGPPGPPPYGGGPVPPGGFHMEPFPYYHPQVPAPGLASSPPIPPGAGHHGHRPKNGDISHMPHVPHMHPRISMRPGFYPGPVHYDGFYRPPLGFCNPSERDLPFMGMPAGPPIYTIHGSQNGPDLNNAYPRSREGQGPKQVEPGHPRDPQGHYKGFGHPNDSWSQNEEEKWSHSHEKGILSKPPLKENAWGDDYTNDEDIRYGKHETFEVASRSFDDKFVPINASSGKFSERLSIINETQTRSSIENVASTRDHSLIQKIEGLNAKARATGRKQEGFQEAPNDRVQMINPMDHQSAIEAIADVGLERHYPSGVHVPVSCCNDVSAVDKSQESAVASGTVPPRRSGCGAQYRGGSHTRVGFHGQESDESERKPGIHSVLETGSRSLTNHQVGEHNAAVQAAEQSKTNVMGKCDGEFVVSSIDPSDMQRARMREIAKQRAIQLQKEEDERVREQKAKALAKLEELNRRSANQVVENLHQSDPTPPPVDVPKKRDVSRNQPELSVDANRSFGSSSASSNNSPLIIERSTSNTVDFDVSSRPLAAETNRSAYQDDSLSFQKQLPIADNSVDNAFSHRTGPQVREVVKQKQGGHKQRQSVPPEKISVLNAILTGSTDAEKDLKVVSASQEFTGSFVDPRIGKEEAGTPVTAELPVQKRKIPKSGKNRHRVEEPSEAVSSSVIPPKDSNLAQAIPESAEQNSSSLPVYSISTQLSANPKDSIQSSGNHSSSSREDTHGRTSSAWKAQQYRKPRNSQGNRPSEKIHSNEAVWAPVQPHNKLEVADQTSQKADGPLVSSAGDILAHNGSKTRRAEMERYVPKPVAKELAQQGSVQQPSSPSIDPAATDICNGREKASHGHEHVKKARANVESKYVDGKNRHQRPQGSWRQRVSAELTSAQDSLDCSASTSKNIQTCNGSQSTVRSDESFLRGLPSRSEEFLETGPQTFISDGWDSVNDSSSNSLAGFNEVKDHIPSGRGKRHPFKGHKGSGSHEIIDHKNSNVGLTDLLCSHAEANQMDRNISSKDNRAAGDRSVPHWQPKFQGHVTRNQQGNMFRGSQNSIPEDKEALKNETGPSGGSRFSPLDKHSIANDPLSVSENKGASEMMPSTGNQEAKQNRRVASVKKRSDSSSQEPEALAGEVEPVSFGPTDGCNEQHPSGYRKNANHSGRSDRGHAVREDWSSTGQENKQRFSSANRERQRQNSHYEYQPVGPYNGGSRSNGSGVQSENQSVVSGVQDRGQNYSRRGRGNFRGRQSGIE